MKKIISTFILLGLSLGMAFAQGSLTITESLSLPQNSSDYTIKIMNLHGKVHVKGQENTTVSLQAQKTVEARRNGDAQQLERDWSLVFRQEGNTILVYADGPGVEVKQNSRGEWNYNVKHDSKNGHVKFDIDLQVPSLARVEASTINGGDVKLLNLSSDGSSASNVNGNVRLINVGGNVTASTVNGDIELESKKTPSTDTKFSTVNGAVRLTFPAQLAANVQYSTVSGDFYTDFDVTASPLKETAKRKGSTYYKVGGKNNLQIGQGGPKIKVATVNGDMYLKKGNQ